MKKKVLGFVFCALSVGFSSFGLTACASRRQAVDEVKVELITLEQNADAFARALYAQDLDAVMGLSEMPFYLNHSGILRQEKDWKFTLERLYSASQATELQILSRQILNPQNMLNRYPDLYALMIETGFDRSFFALMQTQGSASSARAQEKVILILSPQTGKIRGFFTL